MYFLFAASQITVKNNFKLHDITGKCTAPNLQAQIDTINKTAAHIKNI
jgi:hypothetical protein